MRKQSTQPPKGLTRMKLVGGIKISQTQSNTPNAEQYTKAEIEALGCIGDRTYKREIAKSDKLKLQQEKKRVLKWEDPRLCKIDGEWVAVWAANTPIGEFIIESRIEVSKDFTIKLEDCFLEKADSHYESVGYVERYMAKIREKINEMYL